MAAVDTAAVAGMADMAAVDTAAVAGTAVADMVLSLLTTLSLIVLVK